MSFRRTMTPASSSPRPAPQPTLSRPTIPASAPGDRTEQAADAAVARGRLSTTPVTPSQRLPVSPGWQHALAESAGRGRPLPRNVDDDFSLSRVRVHSDDRAAELCLEIGARAFTYGRDIYFGRDRFDPGTADGRRLLAHELAHTQQLHAFPFVQRQTEYVVVHGDTLSSIAQRYGVTVDQLRAANNLPAHSPLHTGQKLQIPSLSYTVVRGDTLYGIAHRFGVTETAIKSENHLRGNGVKVGQVLQIPRQHTVGTTTHPAAPAQQPAAPAHPTQTPTVQAPPPPAQPQPAAAPQAAPATAATGHLPGHDYAGGNLRQRSDVFTAANLKTVRTSHHHDVFFANHTHVDLVSVDANDRDLIEVRGAAFENTSPHPTPIAAPVTGWIHRSATDMTLGVFRDLDVTDRTATFGKLSQSSQTSGGVSNIILHQTESTTQASTLSTYKSHIKHGGDVGAQFLISETGEISDITGLDRRVSQVGAKGVINAGVTNANSVGIEHVGMYHAITPAPKPPGPHAKQAQRQAWTADMQRVRSDLSALPLSPALKQRLLALSDRKLWQTLRDTAWAIYGDINAAQKRSSFLLTQRLRAEYGLNAADMYAHEAVRQKTLGEGENIQEFLTAREAYPRQVQALRALATARTDLQKSTAFMSVLQNEESVAAALSVDATATENAALAAERSAGHGGPASTRETARTRYYQDFWARAAQVAGLLQFLNGPDGSDMSKLNALLATWRF